MSQRNDLRLDRIVASQPELGPSVPDGGYGWFVFVASLFLQVFLPSILSSYGIFMLYFRLENSGYTDEPKLWDAALLPTPVAFMAFWSLADPWSRTIVASSSWPRLVTTSGIFLTSAGLLIQWLAMRDMLGVFSFMFAGALSGFGCSLALTQSEVLISQYFRLKLSTVTHILICGYSLGFIIIPIILGLTLLHKGILHGLLIYQAIILQCVIIILVFKKPLYLKAARRRYEMLQNMSEDDEMIFAKDEIIQPTGSSRNNTASSSISNNVNSNAPTQQTERKRTLLIDTFDDDNPQETTEPQQSNEPRPIFSETEISQTNSYSYDNNIAIVNDDNVTIITPERIPKTSWKEELFFLRKLSFYKSLFLLTTIKYSALIFWMLFPTYLYIELDSLRLQQTTFIVGSMGLGSLLIGFFLFIFPLVGKNKQILTAAFMFLSSIGYFILSDAGTEGWILFGALHVTTSITALHSLYPSIIKSILKEDNDRAHTLLHTLVGIFILLLLVQDIMYRNCFRLMSAMQLLAGFMLICSMIISYFRRICTH